MSVKTKDAPTATVNKYQDYQTKCIELLNKLITPCPKVNEQSPDNKERSKGPIDVPGGGQGPEGKGPQGQGPIDVPGGGQGPQGQGPDKSSSVLKHNGQVGSLEELLVFLIKAPTTNDLKMKLNDVYKIFNPTARDIVSKQPPSA